MLTRKYCAEGGLILDSGTLSVISAADIKAFRDNTQSRGLIEGTNIYVIAQRRRICVEPRSLRYDANMLTGVFQISTDGFEACFPFEIHLPGTNAISSVYFQQRPEGVFVILAGGSTRWYPTWGLVRLSNAELGEHRDFEVLYVGQAFGKTGRRLAVDRLSNHRALRRIQNDVRKHESEKELFVHMYQFGGYANLLSTDGDLDLEPQSSIEEEVDHLVRFAHPSVERRLRIYLAEAALIRYFRPCYNEIYKRTFPSKKHMIVLRALGIGYSALIVQIDSAVAGGKLWSPALKEPNTALLNPYMHYAQFPLTSELERETFIRDLF